MAPATCSAGRRCWSGGRRQRQITKICPRNDTALSANTAATPAVATTMPPMAGPIAWAAVNAVPFSTSACGRSSRGTSSGTIAAQTGMLRAAPTPSRKVRIRSAGTVARPRYATTASTAATTAIHTCATSSSRRRSNTSVRAPAGRASRKVGAADAKASSDTTPADVVRSVISHAAPMPCIHVPMFDASDAIHSQRKTR